MHLRRAGDPSSHPEWRDEEAAIISTTRLVRLAEKHKRRVHVLHVSTAAEMAFLADHKAWASVEVTPHHLTLVAPECYEKLGTYAQMNPPVRDDRHRQAIWAGLAAGTVDVLGSDHAPHTREEKDHAYPGSHSGMTGVQTLVPIMLDHVNAGRLTHRALRRSDEPRAAAAVRHPRQGSHRRRLRCRFHRCRFAARKDDHACAGGQPRRLDALRRQARQGLAGGHLRARPPRDVGRRDRRGRTRRPSRLPRRLLS